MPTQSISFSTDTWTEIMDKKPEDMNISAWVDELVNEGLESKMEEEL